MSRIALTGRPAGRHGARSLCEVRDLDGERGRPVGLMAWAVSLTDVVTPIGSRFNPGIA